MSDPGTGRERGPKREPRERRTDEAESGGGVWFRLDIGRAKNADPKWLLPMLCKRGGIQKRDVGVIRIFDRESKVEIAPGAADMFAAAVMAPGPKGDNILIERTDAPGGQVFDGPRRRTRPGAGAPRDEASARGRQRRA